MSRFVTNARAPPSRSQRGAPWRELPAPAPWPQGVTLAARAARDSGTRLRRSAIAATHLAPVAPPWHTPISWALPSPTRSCRPPHPAASAHHSTHSLPSSCISNNTHPTPLRIGYIPAPRTHPWRLPVVTLPISQGLVVRSGVSLPSTSAPVAGDCVKRFGLGGEV